MGGDRNHPLVTAVAAALAAAGVAALRIDLTDPDIPASALALEAAADDVRAEVGVDRLFLVGYSWGSLVTAWVAPAGLVARVLVAPPVSAFDLAASPAAGDGLPALLLVPAHDQYGSPDAVSAALEGWPTASLEVIEGCDHFLAGAIATVAQRSVGWLAHTG